MNNLEKLKSIFAEVFSFEASQIDSKFDKTTVDCWDSVHQFSLTTAIEDGFDLMLTNKEILSLTSYENAVEILKKHELA